MRHWDGEFTRAAATISAAATVRWTAAEHQHTTCCCSTDAHATRSTLLCIHSRHSCAQQDVGLNGRCNAETALAYHSDSWRQLNPRGVMTTHVLRWRKRMDMQKHIGTFISVGPLASALLLAGPSLLPLGSLSAALDAGGAALAGSAADVAGAAALLLPPRCAADGMSCSMAAAALASSGPACKQWGTC